MDHQTIRKSITSSHPWFGTQVSDYPAAGTGVPCLENPHITWTARRQLIFAFIPDSHVTTRCTAGCRVLIFVPFSIPRKQFCVNPTVHSEPRFRFNTIQHYQPFKMSSYSKPYQDAMAIDPDTFHIRLRHVRQAVAHVISINNTDFLTLCRSPKNTIGKILNRGEWLLQADVSDLDAWSTAVFTATFEPIESVVILKLLDNDLRVLADEVSRIRREGGQSYDRLMDAWEAVAEDVRNIVERTGFYLLSHHRMNPLTEEEPPTNCLPAILPVLLHRKLSTSLRYRIFAVLEYFDHWSDVGQDFNGFLQTYLRPVRVAELVLDVLESLAIVSPSVSDETARRSSVWRYKQLGPPQSSDSKVEALFKAWNQWACGERTNQSLWKVIWCSTYKAMDSVWRQNLHADVASDLHSLLDSHAFLSIDSQESTPKRKSRAQVLGEARKRKNLGLIPSARPTSESHPAPLVSTVPRKTFQLQNLSLKDVVPHWGTWANPTTENRSQWQEDAPRETPKEKTRGIRGPERFSELPEEGLQEHLENDKMIFTSHKLYDLWREVFPLPGE